jgi:broad specificity phosphatase PhoE
LLQTIYFHRHGQTPHSIRGTGYGNDQYRSMLTDRGVREAELLGEELAKRAKFEVYYTSPLPRAVQTATIVQRYIGTALIGEPALIEPINEATKDTWERVSKFAHTLLKTPHERILLSTHGYIFYCLTAYFRGLDLRELKDFKNPPTGAFGWVEIVDGKPIRACRESSGHLSGLDSKPLELEATF